MTTREQKFLVTIKILDVEGLVIKHSLDVKKENLIKLYCEGISELFVREYNHPFSFIIHNHDEVNFYFNITKQFQIVDDNKKDIKEESEVKWSIAIKDTNNPNLQIGQKVMLPIDISNLNNDMVYKVKQAVHRKIIEVRNEIIFKKLTPFKDQILIGVVLEKQNGNYLVKISSWEGFLPIGEQIYGEELVIGEKYPFWIKEIVKDSTKMFPIVLSRAAPEFLAELMKLDIPEIQSGAISVVKIGRVAGFISRVMVRSYEEYVDAVSTCIGRGGARINSIRSQINNEIIDLIPYNKDPMLILKHCFSSCDVKKILFDKANDNYFVVVDESNMGLAFGRHGSSLKSTINLIGKEVEVISHTDKDVNEIIKEIEISNKNFDLEHAELKLNQIEQVAAFTPSEKDHIVKSPFKSKRKPDSNNNNKPKFEKIVPGVHVPETKSFKQKPFVKRDLKSDELKVEDVKKLKQEDVIGVIKPTTTIKLELELESEDKNKSKAKDAAKKSFKSKETRKPKPVVEKEKNDIMSKIQVDHEFDEDHLDDSYDENYDDIAEDDDYDYEDKY